MRLRTLLIIFIFLFLGQLAFAQDNPTVKAKEIETILGIDRVETLDFTPSGKGVQIGNENVLNVQIVPQKKQATFKGIKAGKTSVILRDAVGDIKANYLVTVTANDQSKTVQELKELIGDVEGLEIGIKGNRVVVGGQIVVPSDIGRVVVVLEKFGDDILRLVELSPQTQRIIARKMQEEIQKSQLRDVTVRVLNGIFILEGVVGSDGDKARAQEIANTYIPDKFENLARTTGAVAAAQRQPIQNLISINRKNPPPPVPKQVKIVAQFVELTKDYNKVFGFKWTPFFSGDGGSIQVGKSGSGVTTSSQGTLSATISNLFPKLSSARSAGYARVMQSGVVVTKEGVQASITKQSTKPFALAGGNFTEPPTAEAGFTLNVEPRILPAEKIEMRLGVRVSANVGDPPETQANNISTTLVVKSKESAVVGGIVVDTSSTAFDKNAPGGNDNAENATPLFSFVRSKAVITQKSQFVVFITPEIIESASAGTAETKRKFRRRQR